MDIRANTSVTNNQQGIEPFKHGFLKILLLRPHDDSNLTPIAAAWIAFSLIVIGLMATLEGNVWFLISLYLAPTSSAWVKIPLATMIGFSIFSLIWVTDASFIMLQRPRRIEKLLGIARWKWGVSLRLMIILISILITAPFLNQAIREDDIKREFDNERANVKTDVLQEIEAQNKNTLEKLNKQQEDLNKNLSEASDQRQSSQRIREDAKTRLNELENLERTTRANLTRNPYPGESPRQFRNESARNFQNRLRRYYALLRQHQQARAAHTQAVTMLDQFRATYDELFRNTLQASGSMETQTRLGEVQKKINDLNRQLSDATKDANDINLTTEAFAGKYNKKLPENTLGFRVALLSKLEDREHEKILGFKNPDGIEQWLTLAVFHIKTVEGLSQAGLGILFLSLLVIKFFEPESLRLYYNEELQEAWKRYLAGYLDHLPSFKPLDRPRMAYVEFARNYSDYLDNPDDYLSLYNQRLLEEYKTRERDAELLAHINDEKSRTERSRIQNNALEEQLALELKLSEKEKELLLAEEIAQRTHERQLAEEKQRKQLEMDENRQKLEIDAANAKIKEQQDLLNAEIAQAKKDHELREKRLQEESAIEKGKLDELIIYHQSTREHEQKLARLRYEEELKREKERLDNEIAISKAEFEERKAILEAEKLQTAKDQALRERRLLEEFQLERERLTALSKDLDAKRIHEERLADMEIKKKEREERRKIILAKIETFDKEKRKILHEQAENLKSLNTANEDKNNAETERSKANEKPKELDTQIKSLEKTKKKTQAILAGLADADADDEYIDNVKGKLSSQNERLGKLRREYEQSKPNGNQYEGRYNQAVAEISRLTTIADNYVKQLTELDNKLKDCNKELDNLY